MVALNFFVISALAISTFFIDIKYFIIPDLTTYPVMIFGLFFALLFPSAFGCKSSSLALILSSVGLFGSLFFMSATSILGRYILKRDALGWGDVKYMGAVGACFGPVGAFFTLLLGSVIGSIYGLLLVVSKGKKLKTAIPFGPFLAVATILWIFFGEKIIMVYLNFSNTIKGVLN